MERSRPGKVARSLPWLLFGDMVVEVAWPFAILRILNMKLKPVLIASAVYLGLVGLGIILVPRYFGIGAVPPDAPPALIAFLRIFGGPCLGIAVLNWTARDAGPSPARDAIVLANIVGFGCVASMDVWGVASGGARPIAKAFLIVHLLFTLAFIAAARPTSRGTARALP